MFRVVESVTPSRGRNVISPAAMRDWCEGGERGEGGEGRGGEGRGGEGRGGEGRGEGVRKGVKEGG